MHLLNNARHDLVLAVAIAMPFHCCSWPDRLYFCLWDLGLLLTWAWQDLGIASVFIWNFDLTCFRGNEFTPLQTLVSETLLYWRLENFGISTALLQWHNLSNNFVKLYYFAIFWCSSSSGKHSYKWQTAEGLVFFVNIYNLGTLSCLATCICDLNKPKFNSESQLHSHGKVYNIKAKTVMCWILHSKIVTWKTSARRTVLQNIKSAPKPL